MGGDGVQGGDGRRRRLGGGRWKTTAMGMGNGRVRRRRLEGEGRRRRWEGDWRGRRSGGGTGADGVGLGNESRSVGLGRIGIDRKKRNGLQLYTNGILRVILTKFGGKEIFYSTKAKKSTSPIAYGF